MSQTEFKREIQIPVDHLRPNPDNPRKEAGDVSELAASIKENGLLEPLLVRPDTVKGGDYFIIEAGFRRWTAGKTVVPTLACRISIPKPGENPARRALVIGLVENIHRKDLNIMEKAKAYQRMREELDMTQAQIAKAVGLRGSGSVSRALALLDLSEKIQQSVIDGKVSVDDALKAVTRNRQNARIKKGQKPVDNGWEPDHFTDKHFLAKRARHLCDERGHTNRRRLGNVACGHCWETVIRADEARVQNVAMREAGVTVPFISPEQALLNAGRSEKGAH